MIICLGPVCVPLHLLLAFLLSILHKYGWFTWIKTEWVTWKYWKDRWRNRNKPTTASAVSAPCSTTQPPTAESSMKMGSSECNSTPGTASCQAHCISSDQPVEASLLAAGQENLESPEAQGPAAKMEDSNMGTGVRQRLQQSAATE
uniref:Uncharacterized protein n=1 Tax=Dunaliella tertiolecta TaxID=3047 RepID=A0A7S3R529_DUNTE|mmetsp:Transcript_25137/g.68308  ORF Transcript_25137/g.68308 Transcript_25137/m.68308 type:complete len:146 (-) Transcript_25137:118-555(-)